MKRSRLNLLGALAVGVVLGRSAQAETILTFDAAPPGQVNGEPVISSFGDNAGSSSTGVEVIGFGSPGIGLAFGGGQGAAARWDYYIGGPWSAGQLNGSSVGNFHTIVFTPTAQAAVSIKSFNFHPYYDSSETFNYTWSVRDRNTVLASGTVSFGSDATKNHPVTIEYTGNLGQALTLRLDRTGGTGDGQNIAVDDIRFAQLPVPGGPYLLSVTPNAGQTNVAPNAPFDGVITNGTSQLVTSSVRLFLNGTQVTPTVTPLTQSARVSFTPAALLPSGSSNLYRLTFTDNAARSTTNDLPFIVGRYVNIQLPAPIHFEDFNAVSEGALPAGWSVQNSTSPLAPGSDPNDVTSDFYLDWAVVSRSTVSNLGVQAAGYLSCFSAFPYQVVNNQVLNTLFNGNMILAASDGRIGIQVQYLFTGDYNLSGRNNVYLAFHNILTQNQDSIGAVEYSIDGGTTWLPGLYMLEGPDVLRNSTGQIDASNTLATVYGDVADPATMTAQGGHYGLFVGVAPDQWPSLGPYISARINDNTVDSKRVELIRLPQADNQPAVRFRFASEASDSWHFGIDNFGLYSGAVMPPLLLGVTPASRTSYVGATVTFEASARGAIPLGYQWRKNGVNVPGQTSQTLALPGVQLSDAGDYTVVVTSSGISVTSAPPVSLTVLPTPSCVLSEDLAVYLNFDNNINGQGGTTVNGTAQGAQGVERYIPGVLGQAASFRNDANAGGPSDWVVNLGNQDALYAGNFTVALWVKTGVTSDGALTGNKDWNSGGNVGWLMDQYDAPAFVNFRASGGARYDEGSEIRDGVWHHVAVTVNRDTNGFVVYLDGARVGGGTIGPTGAESLGAGLDTLIGGSGPGYYSGTADIDDYAIWTGALSADQVTCVYANAFIGTSVDELPSKPQLRIARVEFGEVSVSWSTTFTGYTLECSETLDAGAVWSEVSGVVDNTYTFHPDQLGKFFRLRKP